MQKKKGINIKWYSVSEPEIADHFQEFLQSVCLRIRNAIFATFSYEECALVLVAETSMVDGVDKQHGAIQIPHVHKTYKHSSYIPPSCFDGQFYNHPTHENRNDYAPQNIHFNRVNFLFIRPA